MNRTRTDRPHWLQDRFLVCLLGAVGLHVLLLGIKFGVNHNPVPRLVDTLDVVLVKWRSDKDPKDADFLAQASQQGGGDSAEKVRPSQPVSGEIALPKQGHDASQSSASVPVPQKPQRRTIIVKSEQAAPLEKTEVEQPPTEVPSAARLMSQSMNMASLQPEVGREQQWQAKLPRRKRISANTREYEYASYMNAWVAKVERVGNLNYPPELREKKLHGDLILSVGIYQNGSVESIEVLRSSGIPEIDNAAKNIVRIAGPYAPLPDNIRKNVDILHIVRTWRFEAKFGAD